jgi:hypothetical protein
MAKEGRRKWLDRIAKVDRTVERIADAPANLVGRGRPITDSAKRDLWEKGVDGVATVVKAPSKHRVSQVQDNVGRFTVSIEIPDEPPYETNVWQEFMADEWKQMQPGMEIPCKVDPGNHDRIWLTPTGFREPPKFVGGPSVNVGGGGRITDSSQLLASGKRARARVLNSEPMGKKAPGTDDEFFLLDLELSSDEEPNPWKANFGQRVPQGAEELVAEGRELEVAYDGGLVAVDWPASSDGRFA